MDFFSELDDHRIFIKLFKDSDQNSNLSIQPFRWLWNSSRIRWPQNSHIKVSKNIGGCVGGYRCVCQDFGLNARRKENLNPKKRERELYSRLKRLYVHTLKFLLQTFFNYSYRERKVSVVHSHVYSFKFQWFLSKHVSEECTLKISLCGF